MTGPWTRDEASASGQVFEFRVWAALTEQSRGSLHLFLPLTDRGVDGLVHRLTDGAYIPVQAKGRSALMDGEVHLVVWAGSLAHDDVIIVSGLIVDGGLGPTMLVVPAGDFRRLAELSHTRGRPIYSMGFGMHPRSDSRWLPWLVPPDRLAERFGVGSALAAVELEEIVSIGKTSAAVVISPRQAFTKSGDARLASTFRRKNRRASKLALSPSQPPRGREAGDFGPRDVFPNQ